MKNLVTKTTFFFFTIGIFFWACSKSNNNLSVSDILTSHYWNPDEGTIFTYDSTASGYVLINVTHDSAAFCNEINYEFLKSNQFKTHSACINIFDSIGKWSLSVDSNLSALIPQDFLGQSYYLGIGGKISEIDQGHFTTFNYRIFYNYNQGVMHKDSIVTISTYKQ